MDNPDLPPLTQADIAMLRSFMSRIPQGISAAPVTPQNVSISAPPAFPSTQPPVAQSSIPFISQPIAPYQPASLRTDTMSNGHPARAAPPPSILNTRTPSQPQFQGIQSLGTGVTRQIVNQQRLASAAATIPRQPALQARTARRGRPPGSSNINPPGLPPLPTMDNAIVKNEDGTVVSLRVRVKIYPPTEAANTELVLFTNYVESFNATLESYFLVYDYEINPSSTVANLTDKIIEDMTSCPMEYEFSARYPPGIVRNEALPIRLLALTNRGRVRQSTGQVHLQRMPSSGTTPICELFNNKNFYANPRLCLENDRFVLHFVVVHYPLIAKFPSENTTETRRHNCISYRIYRQFPYDGYIAPTDEADPYASSGGETDVEDTESLSDSGSSAPLAQRQPVQLQSVSTQLRRQVPASASAIRGVRLNNESTERPDSDRTSQTSSPSLTIRPFLPPRIWESNWSAPPIRNRIEDLLTTDDVSRHIYDTISPEHRLSMRGKNAQDLAARFCSELAVAAASKDFTAFFSADREFIIENEDGTLRSFGTGVEHEVLYLAFQQLHSNPGQWFYPRIDNAASIAVMHTFASSSSISTARLQGMFAFGALTAILLVHGIPPLPLSPIFLQWIIHGCDLNALHSDLISEWHPELFTTIKRWITMGPTGSLASFQSHFSTWHDTQLGLYHDRDEASHMALASEMLYRAVIGSEPPEHPEIQEFIAGFKLPCSRSHSFDFSHVLKSFCGGPELYLSLIWTSQIKSFNDLAPYIRFRPASNTLTEQAFSPLGSENATLQDVLSRFLKLTGIPCPKLFNDAKVHFSDLINLDNVNEPAFRSKMFCWAATGCPSMATDSGDITVYLVNDNDTSYSLPAFRDVMIDEGKISFKTCSRQVRIPASHFAVLSHGSYDESTEPTSRENAIHHWLLCEILNAIGHHSML